MALIDGRSSLKRLTSMGDGIDVRESPRPPIEGQRDVLEARTRICMVNLTTQHQHLLPSMTLDDKRYHADQEKSARYILENIQPSFSSTFIVPNAMHTFSHPLLSSMFLSRDAI